MASRVCVGFAGKLTVISYWSCRTLGWWVPCQIIQLLRQQQKETYQLSWSDPAASYVTKINGNTINIKQKILLIISCFLMYKCIIRMRALLYSGFKTLVVHLQQLQSFPCKVKQFMKHFLQKQQHYCTTVMIASYIIVFLQVGQVVFVIAKHRSRLYHNTHIHIQYTIQCGNLDFKCDMFQPVEQWVDGVCVYIYMYICACGGQGGGWGVLDHIIT